MNARKESVRKYIAAVLCLTGAIGFAQAETTRPSGIYAEGGAAIVLGDRDAARQRALADALNQASLSMGARVMATEHLNAGDVPLQSQQIRTAQQVARYSILREWEDQAVYHVAVSAEGALDESAAEKANSIHAVKKKVAIAQFDVANTIHVDDINNIYDGLPLVLSNRLEAGGGFLSTYVGRSIPREMGASQRETIIQIAEETGVQFLISGMVVNAGISQEKGILGTSLGGYKKRHIEIELAVYDGLTGARLFSHRLEGDAQGEVMIGNDKPFGASTFFSTESGRVLDRLIDAATINIRAALACLPFSAHIVRVEGKSVYLDAGAVSMLKVGDKLVLYTMDSHLPIVGARGATLGMPERPVTTVTLIKIQPQFSIGELSEDSSKHGVKAGSIARFEFSDKERGAFDCLQ